MPDVIEKAPRAGGAFSELPLHDGAGNSDFKLPQGGPQEPILRAAAVIPAAHRFRRPPPRHALYAVRIAARREGYPHGQSRPFRLNDHDIDELVEHAWRLENRGLS